MLVSILVWLAVACSWRSEHIWFSSS